MIRLTPVRLAVVASGWLLAGCATGLEQRFQAHINYLASDELEGRGVGSRGIELASDYIAGQFASIGLEPAGDDGTYFQTFPLTLHRTLTTESRLAFSGDKVERHQGTDFIPFNFSSDDGFSGGVVFCGYGISNPDKTYDDYKEIDLTGKVALMLDGEPPSWADENGNPTRHAMHRNKVYNAKDRGAVAVFIVSPKPAEGETDRLTEFVAEGADAYGIPAFHVTRAMADDRLAGVRIGSLDELQGKLDAGGFASGDLAHVSVTGQAGFKKTTAPTRNVLGLRRGVGSLADELVIIGAHYDHLGIRKPMMRKFKGGKLVAEEVRPQIHNGADDNASGASGLIEIGRMFAAAPPPRRGILFIAFTAEESGLHGSKHYIDNPAVP
ncbi:MAG: M28 family peptidase, partial [Planctomycetota bacterium]